jgi:hypothetical protein
MNELESFIKRHNISEKEVYLLSKLESLKKIETSKNINKITLKQEAILKNYSLTEPEKIKLFEMLENSIFHQIKENVIKYRDFENEILLESGSNKINKKKKYNQYNTNEKNYRKLIDFSIRIYVCSRYRRK